MSTDNGTRSLSVGFRVDFFNTNDLRFVTIHMFNKSFLFKVKSIQQYISRLTDEAKYAPGVL